MCDTIGSDNQDQPNNDADPPLPSQCTQPHKWGQPFHQPEAPTINTGEDDEDQISGEEDDKRKRWTDAELKQFVNALMGSDGYWEKFMKNPSNVFKKVSVLVGNTAKTLSDFMLRLQKSTSLIISMQRH